MSNDPKISDYEKIHGKYMKHRGGWCFLSRHPDGTRDVYFCSKYLTYGDALKRARAYFSDPDYLQIISDVSMLRDPE
jgi:hypothetical protein